MPRQYPPPRRPEEIKLRYLPDSPERITQSMNEIGYQGKLERVVREAIARVNRR